MRRFTGLVLSDVYEYIYIIRFVNGDIYMNFRDATDLLCEKVDHEDLARALGVSVQSIRQARLDGAARARREPPRNWPYGVIRLAEQQIMRNRQLIEQVRKGSLPP